MCLVTLTDKKVAENDIPVKKEFSGELLIDGIFVSPYMNFRYPGNGLQPKIQMVSKKIEIVGCILQSKITYFDGIDEAFYRSNHAGEMATVVSEGYHSMKPDRKTDYVDVFVDCIIPKGAEYYEDATGLMVSDTIVIGDIRQEV